MTVDGLAPNRRYKFTITNYNKIGTRGSSAPVAVVTKEDGTWFYVTFVACFCVKCKICLGSGVRYFRRGEGFQIETTIGQ